MFSPWLDKQPPTPFQKSLAPRRDEGLRESVKVQAAILMRLGHNRDSAVRRCKDDLAWEFDAQGRTGVLREVESLVDAVYARK